MADSTASLPSDLTAYTSDIVSAFVAHNSIKADELPALITAVHASLSGLGQPAPEPEAPKLTPAEIRRSIKPDGLVSFIDGKSYKTLKRHLTRNGLTPAAYRTKYGLPNDYPMVSSLYAATRSELAKRLGLGQQRRKDAAPASNTAESTPEPAASSPTSKGRGRRKASPAG